MSLRKCLAIVSLGIAPLIGCGGGDSGPASGGDSAPAASSAAAAATGTASIAGKVTFGGPAPEVETVRMTADPKCKELHPDGLQRAAFDVAEGGGVGGVVVYVKGVSGSYPAPAQAATLDQQGCTYHPRTLALQTSQDLTIKNSDETLHNIHPRPTKNPEFNVGQPRQGMETTKSFAEAELMIPVGCDVHPWMRAYISVFTHPFFAVTAEDGSFSIANLPAGEYEVEAVHPQLETVTGTLTVADGEAGSLDLAYGGAVEGEAAPEGE
jgi:hypothetical protein